MDKIDFALVFSLLFSLENDIILVSLSYRKEAYFLLSFSKDMKFGYRLANVKKL